MLFVDRIRSGLDKMSIDRLCNYTRWYWQNHIRPHFYQEERILLPYLPQDHPLATQLKEEHAYIRELVIALDNEADAQSFSSLCDLLDKHIRFEEEQVFTFLENTVSEKQLDTIAAELKEHPLEIAKWDDEFWN